jgi:hypothetical protein
VAALFAVTWILVIGLYLRDARPSIDRTTMPGGASAAGSGSPQRPAGAWGQLFTTPIVISPPAEYISRHWGAPAPPQWHFPGLTPEQLDSHLASFGLTRDDIARLRAGARPEPAIRGLVITPDPDLVRRLDPGVRARLYPHLGRNGLNGAQLSAYRYFGESLTEWLPDGLISPETRELIAPLIYRRQGFMYFADMELVRSQISDPGELQRVAKALLRQSTVLVRLRIPDPSQLGAIAEYWGRGGRRVDVRPLLESIVGAGPDRFIDVTHLLPSLARDHLYRYPKVTVADLERPLLANCLWTALNFFRVTPDDRFLDENVALQHLKENYYVVHDNVQLGDVVAFIDGEGNVFHVAVYVADDLVFGKNGTSRLAPWTILSLERLKGHYVEYADEWHVSYHRRKDL